RRPNRASVAARAAPPFPCRPRRGSRTARARSRRPARASPAIDLEPVLLDQPVDVVAIDAGLGGRARDVAAVAREQRLEVVALEALDERRLRLLERELEDVTARRIGLALRRRALVLGPAAARGARTAVAEILERRVAER